MRRKCVSCGHTITKPGREDPYTCRACENAHGWELGRYAWLDAS